MICQATYESLEAIPEALRDEFEQKNGKWQLKESAIPGVGPLFNAAVAANAQKAVDQVKVRNQRITDLETENLSLKEKLAVLDNPGHRALSKEDADAFDRYAKLGTPKEVESRISRLSELEEKVRHVELKEKIQKVATALPEVKLDPEVLSDWASGPEGAGLEFFVKEASVTDDKGKKVTREVPFVKVEKKEGGKVEVTEHELLTYAKANLPEWKYNALLSGGQASQAPQPRAPGVRMPDLGSTKQSPGAEPQKEKAIDKFNKQRAGRPNPFAAPVIPRPGIGVVKP